MLYKYLFTLFFSVFMINKIFSEDFSNVDIPLLKEALQLASGGSGNKSYYNLCINGKKYGGERSWETRWDLIKNKIDFKNKRILDIGCNIGICSIYILKYRGAQSSTGIDRPNSELIKNDETGLIQASGLLQKAFNVKMKILQIDLNSEPYENLIGSDFDFVICMSIFKWIKDQKRFLNYLSNFKEILFEGHDEDNVEIERFKKIGFKNFEILGSTHIGQSFEPGQQRTLIYFYK